LGLEHGRWHSRQMRLSLFSCFFFFS
jgi:hypothetical protein